MSTKMSWQLFPVCLMFLAAVGCSGRKPAVAPSAPPVERAAPPPPPAPARPAPAAAVSGSEEEWFRTATIEELQQKLADVYFEYDRDELRPDSRSTVQNNFDWLKKPYNTVVIEVEGHCDERGTAGYNLALGDRRSTSVASYLLALGFPRERLKTVTYGKERPQCVEAQENCWWKNRRAHFRVASKGTGNTDR